MATTGAPIAFAELGHVRLGGGNSCCSKSMIELNMQCGIEDMICQQKPNVVMGFH